MNRFHFYILVIFTFIGTSEATEKQLPNGSKKVIRDSATNETLAKAFANRTDPTASLRRPVVAKVSQTTSKDNLIDQSDIISFNGSATLVPKHSIIHLPPKYQSRIGWKKGSKLMNWADFHAKNRGWISVIEIDFEQAKGAKALDETKQKPKPKPKPNKLLLTSPSTALLRMKPIPSITAAILLLAIDICESGSDDYINYIRQTHESTEITLQSPNISPNGSSAAFHPITFGTYRFDLWTVQNSPLESFRLDTAFVTTETPLPTASITIDSDDPFVTTTRTRADQPFTVTITVDGLLTNDINAPDAYAMVNLEHDIQSYGIDGTGAGINRDLATLFNEVSIVSNGDTSLEYTITHVPGQSQTKIRGEETFSVFSLAEGDIAAAELDSKFIQIWPVESATISGIQTGDTINGQLPNLTVHLDDLYPDSVTYLQVYSGPQVLGSVGATVPSASIIWNGDVPRDDTISLTNWDALFTSDGVWTVEVLTETPFGTDRLAWTTFTLNRTIEIQGSVTTSE